MTLHGGRAVVTGRRSDAVALRLRPRHLRRRATRSTSRWPRASSSCGACRARSPPRRDQQDQAGRPVARAGRRGRPSPRGCGAGGSRAARPRRWRRCRVSVHFDWRLAPYDLRADRGRTPGCCTAPGCSTTTSWRACSRALDELEADVRVRRVRARRRPTRTCTPRSSAGWSSGSARSAASCAPGRIRNDQVATDLRLYLRDHARELAAAAASTLQTALLDQAEAHVDTPAPGLHPPAARAAGVVRPRAGQARARARARPRPAARLGPRGPRCSPLGAGALAGSSLPLDPEAVAAELGFDRRDRQLDRRGQRPRLRRRVPVRRRDGRRAPVAARRGGLPVDLARVRLGDARRRVVDRLVDHAAEEEPRRRRARPRQVRPADRRPDRRCSTTLKGLPFAYNRDLQEDKEPAFDAVDTLLLRAAGDDRHGRDAARSTPTRMAAAAPEGFALATESPSGWSGRACRSARRTRSPARCVRVVRARGVRPGRPHRRGPGRDLAAPDPGRPRRCSTVAGCARRPRRRSAAPRRPGSPSSSPTCVPRHVAGGRVSATACRSVSRPGWTESISAAARAGCWAGPVLDVAAATCSVRRPRGRRSRCG